jgi:hypothetical protein
MPRKQNTDTLCLRAALVLRINAAYTKLLAGCVCSLALWAAEPRSRIAAAVVWNSSAPVCSATCAKTSSRLSQERWPMRLLINLYGSGWFCRFSCIVWIESESDLVPWFVIYFYLFFNFNFFSIFTIRNLKLFGNLAWSEGTCSLP